MDSTSTVQVSGVESTPVVDDMGRLGCEESSLESSGVHMEYQGTDKTSHCLYGRSRNLESKKN